jgi:predicted aldo/keto reductase-like oxidoreductase
MEYRELGRTGLQVGAIGLGTEHMTLERETMERVLRTAVDAGLNYVDVLFIDATGDDVGFWDNFGPALRPYRNKLILAAHWGGGPRYDMEYCQRCFEDVLARVGNDYAEVGLLTMVDTERKWNVWAQESIQHLLRYKEQGRIGAIGMSTHVAPIALKAVDSGLIDVLMYPLNLTSHALEQDSTVCQACADHDVGLVAMKPYRGGTLLVADGKPSGITPAQCLEYVLSLPVATTVPGAKNAEELRAALHYWAATEEEKDYGAVLATAQRSLMGECTHCNHCLPCPQSIDISQTIGLVAWSGWARIDTDEGQEMLAAYAALPIKASACIECGDCMDRCPFEVDVIAQMQRAVEVFE